jgi:multiple sugar transport system substrate-binding protein
MKKRILIAAMLLLGAATLVLAGGQKEGAAAGGKMWAGKTINVLCFAATYADQAKDISAKFQEETGATVNVITFPYLTLYQKEGLALRTGASDYDVMLVACQWDGEFAPYVDDLGPYINKDKLDTSDVMKNVWQQSGIWNGETVGIPISDTPYLLGYRTDLVPNGVPKTYAELFALAKTLNNPSKGFYAFATPGVKEQFDGMFMIAQWSLGGMWADKSWNVTIDSPQTRQALDVAKQYIQYSDPAALSWGLNEATAAFLQGNAAFLLSWPTLGLTTDGDNPEKSKIVGKWALAQFPHEKTGITNLSSWDLQMPKAGKNKDVAWAWIKAYTAKQAMMDAFKKYTILAPRTSFWQDPLLKTSKLAPNGDAQAVIWWRIPAGTIAETFVRDAVANYVSSQWSIDQAVQYMKDGFTKTLKENPPPAGVPNNGL